MKRLASYKPAERMLTALTLAIGCLLSCRSDEKTLVTTQELTELQSQKAVALAEKIESVGKPIITKLVYIDPKTRRLVTRQETLATFRAVVNTDESGRVIPPPANRSAKRRTEGTVTIRITTRCLALCLGQGVFEGQPTPPPCEIEGCEATGLSCTPISCPPCPAENGNCTTQHIIGVSDRAIII